MPGRCPFRPGIAARCHAGFIVPPRGLVPPSSRASPRRLPAGLVSTRTAGPAGRTKTLAIHVRLRAARREPRRGDRRSRRPGCSQEAGRAEVPRALTQPQRPCRAENAPSASLRRVFTHDSPSVASAGGRAISWRSLTLRPRLATSLPFSVSFMRSSSQSKHTLTAVAEIQRMFYSQLRMRDCRAATGRPAAGRSRPRGSAARRARSRARRRC
jgi:hypothetical protein